MNTRICNEYSLHTHGCGAGSNDEMTEAELEAVADRVVEKMGGIPSNQHVTDHLWIKQAIERELQAQGTRRRVLEQVIGTAGAAGVLAILGWLGLQVIEQFQEWGKEAAHLLGSGPHNHS